MIDQFDGDVAFVLGPDGGDITYIGGQPVMDAGGLENAVNISLFTGPGWWGNALFNGDPDSQIGSDFEERVRPHAITKSRLTEIENAARDALQWMINQRVADEIAASATWPELNTILLEILITRPDGDAAIVRYQLNWEASVLRPVGA